MPHSSQWWRIWLLNGHRTDTNGTRIHLSSYWDGWCTPIQQESTQPTEENQGTHHREVWPRMLLLHGQAQNMVQGFHKLVWKHRLTDISPGTMPSYFDTLGFFVPSTIHASIRMLSSTTHTFIASLFRILDPTPMSRDSWWTPSRDKWCGRISTPIDKSDSQQVK